jgi:hypothetical protein
MKGWGRRSREREREGETDREFNNKKRLFGLGFFSFKKSTGMCQEKESLHSFSAA